MPKDPKPIVEVHELMRRLQNEEKVSNEEVAHHLGKALKNKDSQGTWIRREKDSRKGSEAVSVLKIETEKALVGLRVDAKQKDNK